MKNKDAYIKILEFGINRAMGFTYDEIINAKELKKLKEWEIKIIDKYLNNALINHQRSNTLEATILETMFIIIKGGGKDHRDSNTKYILNYDSRFKYIDYIELKEVRESTRKANRNANIAIGFAVITILISISLTLWQIKSPIEIKDEQVNTIINKITNIIKN